MKIISSSIKISCMFIIEFLKKKKIFLFNYLIFMNRYIKNSFKIVINKKFQKYLIPNFFIKNTIFINPNKIEYVNSIPIKFYKNSNEILMNFNWAETNIDIHEYEKKNYKFITCKELFIKKIELKKCTSYSYFKKKIIKHKIYKNCKNEKDIISFLRGKINLYNNLKKIGLRKNLLDNLEFIIDQNSNLVKVNSGNHRFIISKILNLKKIPIEIKIIHQKNFKKVKDTNHKISLNEINEFIKKIEQRYA